MPIVEPGQACTPLYTFPSDSSDITKSSEFSGKLLTHCLQDLSHAIVQIPDLGNVT